MLCFLFDPDSEQIIDANPMAQRLSGFTRAELLRLKATYVFPLRDARPA